MIQRLFSVFFAFALTAQVAYGQTDGATPAADDIVYIQLKAQTSLAGAQDSVQAYATRLSDVNGFSLGGGWYGIAIGPYERAEAQQILTELVRARRIPADSYIEVSAAYGRQ